MHSNEHTINGPTLSLARGAVDALLIVSLRRLFRSDGLEAVIRSLRSVDGWPRGGDIRHTASYVTSLTPSQAILLARSLDISHSVLVSWLEEDT